MTRDGSPRAKGGAPLTPEAEAALLAEAEAGYDPAILVPRKAPGRPSLSAGGGTSHRINVRVDDEIYEVLQRVARDSGRRPSELVREVLRAAYGPRP
ncbi:ribbon-helix-helix domain-containing protein [Pilimelia anulata]|uniref:ribbon-helix-helix domain-containing protein n=1 Tax=Pilimelia anulata TaxID=53371 RepID=UPI001665C2FE|nr:ribbon-helix-helix domain-containing protein [Pilimelia anulata]